jgi:nitroimidazol reductase NimA-like FMN-containing flavoprotein (pyridoxamine 5'-phosphate oxidase superfamily)
VNPQKQFADSLEEMEKVLREERIGYLGLTRQGFPYVIPLNYGYVNGRILFHCALEGTKLDCIRANPGVCFAVGRQFGEVVNHPQGASCHINSDSVLCFGTARILDDPHQRHRALDEFNRCLQPDARPIRLEDIATCYAVEITVAAMTGRTERDGKCTYGKHEFVVEPTF